MAWSPWLAAIGTIASLSAPMPAMAEKAPAARHAPAYTGNYIVRWRQGVKSTVNPLADDERLLQVRAATGLELVPRRQMGGALQLLHVAGHDADPEAVAARLREDPRIADAVPDAWLRPAETVPNDTLFGTVQQYLGAPSLARGGANLPKAWDRTRGSSNIVIAVVDTGYLPHPDLAARLVAGYDFIASDATANDGNPGRDADATDTGDYVPAGVSCDGDPYPLRTNSWHGTGVAGVIGAVTDNGSGIAGVDWHARIQPVRVSGRCGALLSDTIDGMRWAGGLAVPGVPANPTPARVINISLGGGRTCTSVEQATIDALAARGAIVVAAAGNSAGPVEAPASCRGVVAVTAHANDGDNADYASVGPQVTLSAPGGGCGTSNASNGNCAVPKSYIYTLTNDGTTARGAYTLGGLTGTSFAAPIVSGVVSLMLSVNPSLTNAQIIHTLRTSARQHPAGTYCSANAGACGAGLLDADAALAVAASLPTPGNETPAPDEARDETAAPPVEQPEESAGLPGGDAAPPTPSPTPPAPVTGGGDNNNGGATDGGGGTISPWSAALLTLGGLVAFCSRRRPPTH